jgi:transposase-like protein
VEDYPKNLAEFEARFSDERSCRAYVFQLRWPEGFRCPRCGHEQAWPVRGGWYECAACGYQSSVLSGTIFARTRKPLVQWFRAMWAVTSSKSGISAMGLQRVLGLGSYKTAWSWLQKLRRAMVRPGRDRLDGRVEVDETYVGGRQEGHGGRRLGRKSLVVIAAEEDGRKIGRIRMQRVPDASAASLQGFIARAVAPGSVVHTDGWRGYASLAGKGYRHQPTAQGRLDVPGADEDLLPRVHRVVSLLKRWLLGTHHGAVSGPHLDYYLDEFTFRFNRRTSRSRGKLFYRLVQQAVAIGPAPYATLIHHVRGRGRHKG